MNIENRYDFVLLFDCQDGNPNGDPDSDNSPRIDPETFQGLVSDVCLKRKLRDYVLHTHSHNGSIQKGYDVFVLAGNTLESRQKLPYEHLKGELEAKGRDTKPADIEKARSWMCQNFFDIRAFGAVMSTTAFNCGQVRGPVQMTFARSIDRILSTEHTISRQAFTGEKDVKSGTGTFGRKHTIAYGLYRAHGFINPVFSEKTGFSDSDLTLLWKALAHLFDLDRSAARGLMATRGLYIFKHDSKLGSAPAHRLFEMISVKIKDGVESPRRFEDYVVTVPKQSDLPQGVQLTDGCAMSAQA
ncbi:MAG TPA: type I-C CRISPR-associated protein Cas7/Csd2 [Candidatus Angelobacter sp.]|nr:type I-C CRISPR-associated protein Cas7/Csd2 [Candidatus Angelobacter sp.]